MVDQSIRWSWFSRRMSGLKDQGPTTSQSSVSHILLNEIRLAIFTLSTKVVVGTQIISLFEASRLHSRPWEKERKRRPRRDFSFLISTHPIVPTRLSPQAHGIMRNCGKYEHHLSQALVIFVPFLNNCFNWNFRRFHHTNFKNWWMVCSNKLWESCACHFFCEKVVLFVHMSAILTEIFGEDDILMDDCAE